MFPFFCKILIAPMVDAHFIANMGKCKTYILICGIINAMCLLILSTMIESIIKELYIWTLYGFLMIVFVSLSIQDVAIDAWILTIFEEEKRPKGGLAAWLGQTIGTFLAYNVFVIVNSSDLHSYLPYTTNDPSEPFISNSLFMILAGLYILITTLAITILIAEEKTKRSIETIFQVCEVSYKIGSKKGTLTWMAWVMLKYFGVCLFFKTYNYKMIDLQFKREWLVNISTITFPILIMVTSSTYKLLQKGKLNYYLFNALALSIPMMIYMMIVYHDFAQNQNSNRTYLL